MGAYTQEEMLWLEALPAWIDKPLIARGLYIVKKDKAGYMRWINLMVKYDPQQRTKCND